MKLKSLLHIATLTLALAATAAQANLVTNGDFETGDLTGFTVDPAGQGYIGVDAQTPFEGQYAAFFAGTDPAAPDTISQTLATIPGATYQVQFQLQNEGGATQTGGQHVASFFSLYFEGAPVFTLTDDPGFAYTQITQQVVASSNAAVLSFTGFNLPSAFDLDNISVTQVASGAVPLPGTAALFGLGMVGLACARREKATATA